MRRLFHKSVISIVVASTVAGCSGFTANTASEKRLSNLKANEISKSNAMLDAQRAAADAHSQAVEEVTTAFVGNTQVAAPKSTQWPPSLRREASVTMSFSDNRPDSLGNVVVPLSEFAHQIYVTTGIPVRIKPDALVDAAGKPVFVSMRPNYTGALPDLFDQLTSNHRVFSVYQDGALEFFRTITRTFLVSAPLGDTTIKMESSSGGGDNGFNAKAETNTNATLKTSQAMADSIKQFLSKGVVPVYNDATGSLTITDTPDVLDAVAHFLERENRLMSRQILLDVKVVRYSQTDSAESGVNWTAIYNRVKEMSGASFKLVGPALNLAPGDGSISLISTPGTNGQSRFNGSSMMLQALNEVGNAVVTREMTLNTTNRTPIIHAFNKSFDYVNETTASTSVAGVAVGQKTKTENEGRTIMMVPAISSETEAMVDISIRETVKNPFTSNTIGSGQTQQTVQLLDKDTELIRQRVHMRNGETRVLTGVGRATSEGKNQTLDANLSAIFGGAVSGKKLDEQYFLIVSMRFMD